MRKKKKNKDLAKKIGAGAGIVGGVVAAGYVARKLINRRRESGEPNRDALAGQRGAAYAARGGFETGAQSREIAEPLG